MVKVSKLSARSRREKRRGECKKETVKRKLLDESDNKLSETVELSATAYAHISQQDVNYDVEPPNKVAKQMCDLSVSNGDYEQSPFDTASDVEYLPNCEARKTRYKTDSVYKETKKKNYVEKYHGNEQYRKQTRERCAKRYIADEQYKSATQKMSRIRSKTKYATNERHRAIVQRKSKTKYATDEQHRAIVRRKSVVKYAMNKKHRTDVRKRSTDKYLTDANLRAQIKEKAAEQYMTKQMERSQLDHVIEEFRLRCQQGPEYVCTVCTRLLFSTQVKKCVTSKYQTVLSDLCINENRLHKCTEECSSPCQLATGPTGSLWICPTCDRYLTSGKIPLQAWCNKLELDSVPEELSNLNTLEEQLIALTIPFMKVVPLPKGKQLGIKGPVICVKSEPKETTKVLPRPLSDSEIVGIKLKRRLEYRGHAQFKMVHLKRIEDAFKKLKEINPLYADVELDPTWSVDTGIDFENMIVDEKDMSDDCDRSKNDSAQTQCKSETEMSGDIHPGDEVDDGDNASNEVDDAWGLAHDSCLQPVDIRAEIMTELENHILSVAPAEKNKPHSLLNTPNDEMKAFPTLFPHGVNGFDEKRDTKLSRAKYFNARLHGADLRFAKHSEYIFYAQAQVELERIISGMSIQSRKGTQTTSGKKITASMICDTDQFLKLSNSDQIFSHMQSVRGCPQYWKAVMNDLFAMIRQIGIPCWFATFSSAEISRWAEVVETIARQSGRTVDFHSLDFAEKCEILRSNPVTAVRMFYHRINELMRLLNSPANPLGKITDYFYRVEFQQRGAPHIHCLFWVKNAPKFDEDSDEAVCSFIDRYVCARNVDESDELHSVVKEVQTHSKSHTRSCKKGSKRCRFNFPRPVANRTSIVRPNLDLLTDEERVQQMEQSAVTIDKSLAEVCLQRLQELLDGDVHDMSTESVLNKAGFANFNELLQAVSLISKKPIILLQREVDDVWVNNYSPNVLRAWNANMDIQYVMDAYSCVMYILSYISKSEHELGQLLREAKIEMDTNPNSGDLKAQMKKLGLVYFENREVSVQEAVVRTTGLHLKECSRSSVYVSTDENQVRLSKPLAEIMNVSKRDGDSDDIWVTCLYDKYKARPKTAEFDRMCQATFASQYRFISKAEGESALAKGNAHVHKLQNELGYIMKRTVSDPAIVRFPKFSSTKDPEKHHMSLLKLYLPHRTDVNLKPRAFSSYEHFYERGSVRVTRNDEIVPVKAIVLENRNQYECLSEVLQDIWQEIQRDGCQEDAWASIAPQAQQERLDDISDRAVCDEVFGTEDVPDLADSSASERLPSSLCSVELLSDSMRSLLRTMNAKQRQIFYFVRQWCIDEEQDKKPKPFMLFVNGGAGVGKSHLIKCVYNEASKILRNGESPLDTTVLLTAPTGTAAFNIGGFTLHSALKIPRKQTRHYEPLADDTLNTLSAKLGKLKLLIIDEISMVDRKVLAYVHGRLKQIKHIRFSEKEAWFGNVCILAVGDFYQLPPVRAKSLLKPDSSMGIDLWHDLFSVVELSEIMRQKDDEYFATLLNSIRVQQKGQPLQEEYCKTLQSRAEIDCVPTEAIHVFAKNKGADDHNSEMLNSTCTHVVHLTAVDYEKSPSSTKLVRLEETKRGATDDLTDVLHLAKGARVMLTRNIDTSDGLVNGAFGTVDHIDRSCDDENTYVFVTFDNERVGRKQVPHSSEGMHRKPVGIKIHEESKANAHNVVRRQFPLKLAWGCTIHKTQGMTMDKCVVDMAGIFAPGQAYVALSRVTNMDGLFIRNYDPTKIYRCEDVHRHMQNMVSSTQLCDNKDPNDMLLSLVHHNVQGLRSKLPDIKNYAEMHADVLMINETLLKSRDANHSLCISGYTLERQDRPSDTGRGGVAVYVKDSITKHRFQTNVSAIEQLAVTLKKDTDETYVLVTIYRPPAQSIHTFAVSLRHLLQVIDNCHYDNIIIAGDFNECLLKKSSHPIHNIFSHEYGYSQQVTSATTRSGSLLDVVYTKTSKKVSCCILPTYFSDHEAVKVTLSPVDPAQAQRTVSPSQSAETDTVDDTLAQDISPLCVDSCPSHKVFPVSKVLLPSHSNQHDRFSPKQCVVQHVSEEAINSTSTGIPRGLMNLGNTCFANSICQVLFSVADLQPLFDQNDPISVTLNVLKSEVYASEQTPVCPDYLFALPQFARWPRNDQQDAHDFLLWLLQKLHAEHVLHGSCDVSREGIGHMTSATQDDEGHSPVTDLINGRFTITYQCVQCSYKSVKCDRFRCVNVYLDSRETVIEEGDYMTDKACEQCRALQTKCTTSMTQCPNILFVLFVRFNGLVKNNKSMKIAAEVITKNNSRYKLMAIVNHNGRTLETGHYTALIHRNNTWYKCNDTDVVKSSLPSSSALAYILMYKKVP